MSYHERDAGGADFGGSLPSAVALLVCMPVGRKECVLDIYFFCASAVRFQGLGEWRKMGAGVSLLAAKALVGYACQRIGIASVQDYFSFCASPVQLSRAGWGGERGVGGSYA